MNGRKIDVLIVSTTRRKTTRRLKKFQEINGPEDTSEIYFQVMWEGGKRSFADDKREGEATRSPLQFAFLIGDEFKFLSTFNFEMAG